MSKARDDIYEQAEDLRADPAQEWPEWIQPTGAHNAYAKGAKVSHNGKRWISDVDANTWEPGVYGWTEHIEEGEA